MGDLEPAALNHKLSPTSSGGGSEIMGDLERAIEALLREEVVLLPTDTVYGFAALASSENAVSKLFALKERPHETALAVLVSGTLQAESYVVLGPSGQALAAHHWPGPLTIVGKRIDNGKLAAGTNTTLGVRCPNSVLVRQITHQIGPIAASSANLHGHPTPTNFAETVKAFPTIDLAIDGGSLSGLASTVVSVVDGSAKVLREGPITKADIEQTLRLAT